MKLTFVMLIAGLVPALAGVVPAAAQDMPPALVVTEPVRMMDFHDQLVLIGRTEARAESEIVAEVSGRVTAIHAKEGTWVKRGRHLVVIDSDRIRFSLEAKEAEAARARAEAELAEKELARAEDLFKKKTLSERNYDQAVAAATSAVENYKRLEAERKQLELDLANCTIKAPYSGFTIRQLISEGEWASPGTPVYEMVDLSEIKVTVDLPERFFGQVSIGSPVSISVSGNNTEPVIGTVTGIAPNASETTHTFPVIVTVANEKQHLGGGMLVRATVSLDRTFSSLAVSKDAIVRQGPQTMVYTIADGKAAPIPVITSSSDGSMVAVTGEGLVEGMPVVVRGNERIFPGSPVRDAAAAGAPGAGEEGRRDAAPKSSSK